MNHSSLFSLKLSPTQAYESFYEKFETFSLAFDFLTPKERDFHCSRDIVLRTKQTHTYTYYKFIQNHFDLHTPSRCNKILTEQGTLVQTKIHLK